MTTKTLLASLTLFFSSAAIVPEARGQEPRARDIEALVTHVTADRGFFEATAAYGFQFGETAYLPIDDGTNFKHPLVHGYAFGATAGWKLVPGLFLVANYEYANARTREGMIENVAESIRGRIDFHTLVVGLRLFLELGLGEIYAELAGGVLFPFSTELEIEYGPGLAQLPDPITGEGFRVDRYNPGVGAHGLLGYRVPVHDRFYVGAAIKVRTFQSNNSGRSTELTNFVTDFTQTPPQAVTTTIEYEREGGAQPTTNPVQDIRLQLALGLTF